MIGHNTSLVYMSDSKRKKRTPQKRNCVFITTVRQRIALDADCVLFPGCCVMLNQIEGCSTRLLLDRVKVNVTDRSIVFVVLLSVCVCVCVRACVRACRYSNIYNA